AVAHNRSSAMKRLLSPPLHVSGKTPRRHESRVDSDLLSRSCLSLLSERRLRGREPRNRHSRRRAAHVVEPGAMAELDGRRVPGVLAADAELQVGAREPPALDGEIDDPTDPRLIDARERVAREDLLLPIRLEEGAHVVAAQAERRLREVVGAEAEEL